MLGLYDTVAAVIESGRFGPRLASHVYTCRNPSVQSIYHAVAIDERRTMFRPLLWPAGEEYWGNPFPQKNAPKQEVQEVWFAGGNGAVGGGSPAMKRARFKVTPVWRYGEARQCGRQFPQQKNKISK